MDSTFIIAAISSIGGMIATLATVYIALKNLKPNLRIASAQEKSNLATAAESAAGALVATLAAFQDERQVLVERIDELEDESRKSAAAVMELQEHRTSREARIVALEGKIKEDLRETAALREEVDLLRKQVAEGEQKYRRAKEVIEKLVKAMKDAEIPLPSDIDLSDSIVGLRWPKKD